MTASRPRGYGKGSVYQRADNGRWIGATVVGFTATGAPRRVTVSTSAEAGEAACQKKLDDKLKEIIRSGVPTEGVSNRTTVKAWSETWLARTVRDVRPKTWSNNRSNVRAWIVPTIGRRPLAALTPADVHAVTQAVRRAGRSTTTALRVHVILTQMLAAAVLEGHQVQNRVLMVKAPGAAVPDRTAVELDDALKMLRAAAAGELDAPSKWAAAFLQGMRQGERLGLTWPCVDFAAQLLDVSWQLQELPFAHGCSTGPPTCGRKHGGHCPARVLRVPDGYDLRQMDGSACLVRPKSASGKRVIPLVPWMAAALLEWQKVAPASPHGLVWPRPDGRPQSDDLDRAAWYALQTAAGVTGPDDGRRPYYLHEGRHTTATLLLEAGTDEKVVIAIMGHSSILTSRRYQTVSQEMTRRALDGIAQRLQLGAGTPGDEAPDHAAQIFQE